MEDPFAEMDETLRELDSLKEKIKGKLSEKEAMLEMAEEEQKKRESSQEEGERKAKATQ